MVAQHYRWDFIGLSTDEKPTPATSEKVVDGSTFYCSDNSKLYVYYKDQWYEKEATGGGGEGQGVTELTSADYNYPANNPNKICLGLLQAGYYIVKAGTKFYPTATTFSSTAQNDLLVEVSTINDTYKNIIYTDVTGYLVLYKVNNNGVDNTTGMTQDPGLYTILTGRTVIDNLTSNYAASPLSAKQGKALNDKIGDLSALNTTDKTSIVAAINEILTRL